MVKNIKIKVSEKAGDVSGILMLPDSAEAVLLFAHGAGAPMNHPFMNKAASFLQDEGIGTLRYNFPYTEKKLKRIDSTAVLHETVRSALRELKIYSGSIPVFAGGKSMGGRMTSQAASQTPLDDVKGLIFFGFPLHPPGKKSVERADHLFNIGIPMLFLQGTRDKLADLDLLEPLIKKLGKTAHIYKTEGADHSFHMLKSAGKSDDEVLIEIASSVRNWVRRVLTY